jgi:N-acetylglutamate synthase-like GNAT family acetyltransferase
MEAGHFRRAKTNDAAAVRALTRAAYAKWVPLIGREPLPMAADHDRAIKEHIIDLWEEEGELLALIETVPKRDHLLIENLAVRPDQQGKGLGETLLRHAEDLARTLGLAEVRLYTNAAFAANLAFYAKRGYREVLRDTMVPGSIAVHMAKFLTITK